MRNKKGSERANTQQLKKETMNSNTNDNKEEDDTKLMMSSPEGCPSDQTVPPTEKDDNKTVEKVTPKTSIFDDLDKLARPLDEIEGSIKVLTSLPLRKPRKDEWVRCNADLSTQLYLYEDKETKEFYIILPKIVESMADVTRYTLLILTVSRSGQLFLWPVTLPMERQNHAAYRSSFKASDLACSEWIRIAWDRNDYVVSRRKTQGEEPEWPDEFDTASEMLEFASEVGAFEVIDSVDHPVVKRYLGLD